MDEKYANPNGCPVPPETECSTPNSIGGMAMGTPAACRMSARDSILAEIARLRRKARELEALAQQIPDGFPYEADQALWQLVMDQRR